MPIAVRVIIVIVSRSRRTWGKKKKGNNSSGLLTLFESAAGCDFLWATQQSPRGVGGGGVTWLLLGHMCLLVWVALPRSVSPLLSPSLTLSLPHLSSWLLQDHLISRRLWKERRKKGLLLAQAVQPRGVVNLNCWLSLTERLAYSRVCLWLSCLFVLIAASNLSDLDLWDISRAYYHPPPHLPLAGDYLVLCCTLVRLNLVCTIVVISKIGSVTDNFKGL